MRALPTHPSHVSHEASPKASPAGERAVRGEPAAQGAESGRRQGLRAPRRGKVFKLLHPFVSYLFTNITVTFFWVFMFVLNRTTIIGRRNVGSSRNIVLVSNHQSMIDSFIVGIGAFYPESWIKPYLVPWNPAAVENFYRTPVLAWLSDMWKCIPVDQGRRDLGALRRMIQVLPKGVMTLFPEGTRSRDGSVGPGRPGAGTLALATRARVIPVAIAGMRDVLPIGSYLPRIFKRIYLSYGPPVDYTDLLERPVTKETAQELVDRAMAAIRAQYADIRARKRRRA